MFNLVEVQKSLPTDSLQGGPCTRWKFSGVCTDRLRPPHAPTTPNLAFGSSREIAVDYIKKSLLQPEMPTDCVGTAR